MIRAWTHPFYLLLLGLVLGIMMAGRAAASLPASPGFEARLSPDRVRVGDQVTLSLTYRIPKGGKTDPHPVIGGLEGMTVMDRKEGSSSAAGPPVQGLKQGEIRLTLLVDRLKDFEIGPLTLTYEDPEGERRVLKTDPIQARVLSHLRESPGEAQLKPIYGIIPTRPWWRAYVPWGLGTLAAGLVAVLFIWWHKRRGHGTEPTTLAIPPHQTAQQQLQALKQERFFEKGGVKVFYFRFSEILKHYLEALRGFPAAEYTTEEIAHAIRHPEDRDLLNLLREADRAKFADWAPTRATQEESLEKALFYVRDTGSVFEPPPAREGGPRMWGRNRARPQESES